MRFCEVSPQTELALIDPMLPVSGVLVIFFEKTLSHGLKPMRQFLACHSQFANSDNLFAWAFARIA